MATVAQLFVPWCLWKSDSMVLPRIWHLPGSGKSRINKAKRLCWKQDCRTEKILRKVASGQPCSVQICQECRAQRKGTNSRKEKEQGILLDRSVVKTKQKKTPSSN